MQCTRDQSEPITRADRDGVDGLGELVVILIMLPCVLHYYAPEVIVWLWDQICSAVDLPEGCRVRTMALIAVQPMDAVLEWVGVNRANSGKPTLGLNIVVLGVVVLSVAFVAGLCFHLWSSRPQSAAPIYFRRTTGPDEGAIEPLADYDGVIRAPIYIAVKGRVFDVSSGAEFYGPASGGYNVLAGQDASRALGIMSLQGREAWLEDCRIRRIDDLGPRQIKVMHEYEVKYCEKYPVVGVLLGRGSPGCLDFIPAEGSLADAMSVDEQAKVTHAHLTRDCAGGSARDFVDRERANSQTKTESCDDDCDQDHSARSQLRCPTGHFLVPTKTLDATYFCDGCGASGLPKNSPIRSCQQCDFDLCDGCVVAQARQRVIVDGLQ